MQIFDIINNNVVNTNHVKRKGSSSLLMTFTIMLSFVSHSILGAGNCPFTRITYTKEINENIYRERGIEEG